MSAPPPAAVAPKAPDTVDAPFVSKRQAAIFCAVVALLLAMPAILSTLGLYRRRDAYQEMPPGVGAYAFIETQVFDERSDVDMLLVGGSMLLMGLDTPYLEKTLAQAEGHPVNVLTFGFHFPGQDVAYAMLRDVLERRHVKTVVMTMPHTVEREDAPHAWSYHFLPYGEDPAMTRGLGARYRLTLYAESILGAPRHLLSLARTNAAYVHPLSAARGAHLAEEGFFGAPYDPLDVPAPNEPIDRLVYAPGSDRFAFNHEPLSAYQRHFLHLIADLLRAHHIQLIVVHVPRFFEHTSPVVDERFDWSEVLGLDAPLVGVPPAVLFKGLSDEQIVRLYCNQHPNASGASLFTRTIAPALVEIHTHGHR